MQQIKQDTHIAVFNEDVAKYDGYKYTQDQLSCKFAHSRITDAILDAYNLTGKSIVDVGCGDGTYTREIVKLASPSSILAFDPCEEAIKLAISKDSSEIANYETSTINEFADQNETEFDVAVLRAVLHHINDPDVAINNSLKFAKLAIIAEPNGYSPILKLTEVLSKYHREHGEMSYGYGKLKKYIEQANGRVIYHKRVGCVPCFWPDFIAKFLKKIEPIIEKTPILNILCCAIDIIVYERVDNE